MTNATGNSGAFSDMASKASEMAGEISDNVSEKAHDLASKASDLASMASEKAGDLKENVSDAAHQLAATVGNKTDDAIHAVGEKMSSAGAAILEKAPQGALGEQLGKVAHGLESGGEYLANKGINDIAADTTQLIRKYPMQSLALGVGIGFLLGAALNGRK